MRTYQRALTLALGSVVSGGSVLADPRPAGPDLLPVSTPAPGRVNLLLDETGKPMQLRRPDLPDFSEPRNFRKLERPLLDPYYYGGQYYFPDPLTGTPYEAYRQLPPAATIALGGLAFATTLAAAMLTDFHGRGGATAPPGRTVAAPKDRRALSVQPVP